MTEGAGLEGEDDTAVLLVVSKLMANAVMQTAQAENRASSKKRRDERIETTSVCGWRSRATRDGEMNRGSETLYTSVGPRSREVDVGRALGCVEAGIIVGKSG